jgi:uncharacterized membrane protein YfcA
MSNELIVLGIAAFVAGLVDAMIGGGGLIQTPAALLTFPQAPVADVLGTTKLPSLSGTALAAWRYNKHRISILPDTWWMLAPAFIAASIGSWLVTRLPNDQFKPIMWIVLLGVAVYALWDKKLGLQPAGSTSLHSKRSWAIGFALLLGFYDGFIGPGTGSFFVLFFVAMMGMDYLRAGMQAKLVNMATNLSSLLFYGWHGHVLWKLALGMALCNVTGAWFGTQLALRGGNRWLRWVFIAVIWGTLLRLGYDIWWK